MAISKGKHLCLKTRKIIYNLLIEGKKAKEIANMIGVHPTMIMREIKNRRTLIEKSTENESLCRNCNNYKSCKLHYRCGRRTSYLKCRDCKQLRIPKDCSKFSLFECNIINRFPLVCNGCNKKGECNKDKFYYSPDEANNQYRLNLVESRKGLNLTCSEYVKLDKTIKSGVDKNQSIYHIVKVNSGTIPVSVKSVYNYINNGKITVKPIDLPRSVSLKKRKTKTLSKYNYTENKNVDRTGRKYSDWLVYRRKNRIVTYWEMDFLGAPKDSEQMISMISFTLLFP